MPGPSNASNRFGSSSYVVGPPVQGLGNGINFTSIQAAYDQAVLDGHGPANPATIEIRPGVYIENLALTTSAIGLEGVADTTGAFGTNIQGTVTITAAAGVFISFLTDITVTAATGSAITTSGANGVFGFWRNCRFVSSDPVLFGIDLGNVSGTFSLITLTESSVSGPVAGIRSTGRHLIRATNTSIVGSTDGVILDGTAIIDAQKCSITASNGAGIITVGPTHTITVSNSSITSTGPTVDTTTGGSVTIYNTVLDSTSGTGFSLEGTGSLEYCNLINTGTAINISPAFSGITPNDWKPYAESGAGPAPSLGTVRGTSCFDSAAFTVTDGFVETNFSGMFPWVDQGISTIVTVNQGNFATAAITLTFPAAVQGDVCKFKCTTVAQLDITPPVGPTTLQVGNQPGTNAASTDIGDAIEFTYHAAGDVWIANNSMGNWVIT